MKHPDRDFHPPPEWKTQKTRADGMRKVVPPVDFPVKRRDVGRQKQ